MIRPIQYADIAIISISEDQRRHRVVLFPHTDRERFIFALNDNEATAIYEAIIAAFNEGLKYKITPRSNVECPNP